MLTFGTNCTGRTTGEVRPVFYKICWNSATGADQGGRDGDHAVMADGLAAFRIPVGP